MGGVIRIIGPGWKGMGGGVGIGRRFGQCVYMGCLG